MLPRVRRFVMVALVAVAPLLVAAPASAQVQGPCTLSFNGVAVDRIDTLDSPLELQTTDTLIFGGTSEAGTLSAEVRLIIGPVAIESDSTTYATPEPEFGAAISLDDVSPYGVGLFRVVGEADGCVGEAWVRISGRFPLATLTGLTALGLALGGITGQLGAIVSRNRWSRSAAALGGIATGSGIAVIAQQFGRLQISYPSLAAVSAVAAVLGFFAAWYLNPALREARRERQTAEAVEVPRPAAVASSEQRRAPSTRRTDASPEAPGADAVRRSPAVTGSDAAPQPPAVPVRDPGPYWCYVMAPTDVFGLTDHTRVVGSLVPGTWYLAKRTIGGWAHVVIPDGDEGWVAESAVHRHG